MRGVFDKRPALHNYRTTWNTDIVLDYLSSLNSNLTLFSFFRKFVSDFTPNRPKGTKYSFIKS